MKADNEIKKNLGNDIRRLFGGNRWLLCRQLVFWLGREWRGCGDERWFEECIRNQGRLCQRHRIERQAMLSHLRFDRYQNCFCFRLPKDRFLKLSHSLLISQFLRPGRDDLSALWLVRMRGRNSNSRFVQMRRFKLGKMASFA